MFKEISICKRFINGNNFNLTKRPYWYILFNLQFPLAVIICRIDGSNLGKFKLFKTLGIYQKKKIFSFIIMFASNKNDPMHLY